MPEVKGEFEIKREMQPSCDLGDGVTAMHVRFEKRFHGPLDAASVVQMLGYMAAVEGSGAYVAIERITGSLEGRAGSFVVQHSGTMARGEPALTVSVIPDSGTDALAGLAGDMRIDIIEGRHYYSFDYTLPE